MVSKRVSAPSSGSYSRKPVISGAICHTGSCGRPSRTGGDSARMAVAVRVAVGGPFGGAGVILEVALLWAARGVEAARSVAMATTTERIWLVQPVEGRAREAGGSGASDAATIVRQRGGRKGLFGGPGVGGL